MGEFVVNAAVFIGCTLIIVAGLFAYTWHRLGSLSKTRDYFLSVEGKGILKGVLLGCLIPVLFALAASIAHAEPVRWGGPTTIFLGIEATKDSSPMCYGGGTNDRLTSNIGVRQQIIQRGPIGLNAQYTHHSCAINRDREGYDAVGVQLEWRIE